MVKSEKVKNLVALCPEPHIGIVISTVIMFILQILTRTYWGILMTVFPYILYLFVLGLIRFKKDKDMEKEDFEYQKIFKLIGLENLDGTSPKVKKKIECENKEVVYFINSNRPLSEWKNKREYIEQAFNSEVIAIDYGLTKQEIKIITKL